MVNQRAYRAKSAENKNFFPLWENMIILNSMLDALNGICYHPHVEEYQEEML